MNDAALIFAVVLPGLLVAHNVADHWVQTEAQAQRKGVPGRDGRIACAAHVATYTATTAATVGLLWAVLGLPISPVGFLAGQIVSAGTHYWADRSDRRGTTLAALAERIGKGGFYRLGQQRCLVAFTQRAEQVQLYTAGRPGDPVQWDAPTLGTGAYALDQSFHWAWLLVAALLTAVI